MRQCLVFVILCMFAALSCSPLMAQSGSIQVQPQFFGITTTTYDQSVSPFQALGIYWPSTSFPGVSIGAEGKGGSYTSWWSLETYPLTLKTNSMFPNGYWQGSFVTIPNGSASSWVALDFMVNAAQNNTPPIDVMYTYWQTPQWAVCYDYGSGYGGDRWGGPTTQNPNAQDCSNAPIIYNANTCPNHSGINSMFGPGTGWCPGPPYQPGDLWYFTQQLFQRYTYSNHTQAFKYVEIWNEPDTVVEWYHPSPGVVDWTDLVGQTDQLEGWIANILTGLGVPSSNYPIYVGPGIGSNTDAAAQTALLGNPPSSYGYLNTTDPYNSSKNGASWITAGSYHYYPAYAYNANQQVWEDDFGCQNNGGDVYTTVECTGNNLIISVQARLADFATAGIYQAMMTEGSWMENQNLTAAAGSGSYLSDMRAYIARYSILTATTTYTSASISSNVSRQYWFTFADGINNPSGFGTLCDNGNEPPNYVAVAPPCDTAYTLVPNDGYGAVAYQTVAGWLGGATVGQTSTCGTDGTNIDGVAGCTDQMGSVWEYSVLANPPGAVPLILWVWDASSVTYTVPSGYTGYKDLENRFYSIPANRMITLSQEPIYLY